MDDVASQPVATEGPLETQGPKDSNAVSKQASDKDITIKSATGGKG